LSRIIKGNFAQAVEYKKIETIKFPVIKREEEEVSEGIEPEEILQQALREKQAILEQGKLEAQVLREQAIEEGFQKGYNEGFNQGKERIMELEKIFTEKFNSLIEDLNSHYQNSLLKAKEDVKEIVIYICSKLINDLINDKEDIVIDLYNLLLPTVTDKKITEIITSPQDGQILSEYITQSKKEGIKVSISEELDKGAVKIMTEQGFILYDLKEKLNEIIKELRMLND
jgi:flagellar assembly protein FliH